MRSIMQLRDNNRCKTVVMDMALFRWEQNLGTSCSDRVCPITGNRTLTSSKIRPTLAARLQIFLSRYNLDQRRRFTGNADVVG